MFEPNCYKTLRYLLTNCFKNCEASSYLNVVENLSKVVFAFLPIGVG